MIEPTLKDNGNTIACNWLIGDAVWYLNGFREITRLFQFKINGQIFANNQ